MRTKGLKSIEFKDKTQRTWGYYYEHIPFDPFGKHIHIYNKSCFRNRLIFYTLHLFTYCFVLKNHQAHLILHHNRSQCREHNQIVLLDTEKIKKMKESMYIYIEHFKTHYRFTLNVHSLCLTFIHRLLHKSVPEKHRLRK